MTERKPTITEAVQGATAALTELGQVIGDRLRDLDVERQVRLAAEGKHDYLSTSCVHEDHEHCQGQRNHAGQPKTAGTCKRCPAQCKCPCHREA